MSADGVFYVSAVLIQDRPYLEVAGAAVAAPVVDVGICPLVSDLGSPSARKEISFTARVDTGADITCVPRKAAGRLMPLLMGRPVIVRAHNGSVERVWTYLVRVRVYGWPDVDQVQEYRPRRGVLLTDSDIGLIGMDIIREWDVSLLGSPSTRKSEQRSERCFSVVVL